MIIVYFFGLILLAGITLTLMSIVIILGKIAGHFVPHGPSGFSQAEQNMNDILQDHARSVTP